jgi:DNA-directed RNA polymerase subunit RPC12/RpoP
MGRYCAECDEYFTNSNYSRNQLLKGDGYSRCKGCVAGHSYSYEQPVTYECHKCYRQFNSSNELNMHMQTHRAKTVSCPVCGDSRFKSGANAIQHVESGYCRGCRGADNARQQIYEFASRQNQMNRYMTSTPMLEYGDYGNSYGDVPDKPYCCPDCNKSFRQLSQLLQHQDNKHRNYNMLTY